PSMSNTSLTNLASLTALCAALSACSAGDASPTLTAPAARPRLSEAPAELRVALTPDGPFDLAAPSEDASAQSAASTRAASGSRASGHVGFPSGIPGTGIASEQYSFVALSVDPATPFAAKGQYELTLATTAGGTL